MLASRLWTRSFAESVIAAVLARFHTTADRTTAIGAYSKIWRERACCLPRLVVGLVIN